MNVVFHYLKTGNENPEAITFPDGGFDFKNISIPAIGDCIMLPFKNESGKKDFKKTNVLSRRFIVDDQEVQDEITLVVTDAENKSELRFAD